jgi:hypothetical protein
MVVLLWSLRVESRESNIANMSWLDRPLHTWNIDSDVVVPNFSDVSIPHAIIQYPQHADSPVKEPYRDGSIEPVVVEIVASPQDNMVPAAYNDEEMKYYMNDEENLVRNTAEIKNAQEQRRAW